jgi:hypothetical protein
MSLDDGAELRKEKQARSVAKPTLLMMNDAANWSQLNFSEDLGKVRWENDGEEFQEVFIVKFFAELALLFHAFI